jgi:type IV pilus assembly protein PilA
MLQHLREARTEELESEGAGEAGFTLIELMVVLLIIAILLAIAIPTFLGVTGSANDRAAQSNLTNALTESVAVYQNVAQQYAVPASDTTDTAFTTAISSSAPEFTWVAAATKSVDPNHISMDPFSVASEANDQGLALAALSKTGTCWYVAVLAAAPAAATAATAGTFYAKELNGATNCTSAYAVTNIAKFANGTGGALGSSYSSAQAI